MFRFAVLGELFRMIWERRTWVLLPPVVALVLVTGLLLLGQATPLGPLLYPIF